MWDMHNRTTPEQAAENRRKKHGQTEDSTVRQGSRHNQEEGHQPDQGGAQEEGRRIREAWARSSKSQSR